MDPDPRFVRDDVARALREDGAADDLTAALIPDAAAHAAIACRQDAVLCGAPWAEEAFRQLSPDITFEWDAGEGTNISADTVVCRLRGPARPLLQGERVALNFLQLLSATATQTRQLAQQLENRPCMLLDTRKTLPGLRYAQKYAVQCGGGSPHRASLAEAVLIKENHWAVLPDLEAAIIAARARHPQARIMVEVESLEQLRQAAQARPDVILLDNFSPAQARQARTQCPDIPLEASGNVRASNLAAYAGTGVARISVGALTKNVQAIDFSMRLERD